MVEITVTDELAKAIQAAGPLSLLVDSRGRAVGQILHTTEPVNGDVAMALERMEESKSGGRFYTTEEVLHHLQPSE